jgi:hypothetical protein
VGRLPTDVILLSALLEMKQNWRLLPFLLRPLDLRCNATRRFLTRDLIQDKKSNISDYYLRNVVDAPGPSDSVGVPAVFRAT